MRAGRRAVRAARQLYGLCLVGGGLDEARVRLVVDRALVAKRRGVLAILSQFERLVRLDRARHSARVVSATVLPAGLRAEVTATIERIYGLDIETAFAEDPALIGGMRLQVGSDVYDGSVRGRLEALRSRL